jgi:hypothetical protein
MKSPGQQKKNLKNQKKIKNKIWEKTVNMCLKIFVATF